MSRGDPSDQTPITAATLAAGTSEAYRDLKADLVAAVAMLKAAPPSGQPDQQRLGAALASVLAVVKFLDHDPAVRAAGLDRPLWDLAAGLKDLAAGADSPWLHRASRTGKPPIRTAPMNIRTIAALAVHELMETGKSKPDAIREVARAVKGLPVTSRRDASTSATVQGWYNRRPGWIGHLRSWREICAARGGEQDAADQRAEALLLMLRESPGLKI